MTAVALGDRIWLIGGRWIRNLPTVEAYDPARYAWTSEPDLPFARGGLTAAVLDGRIHVTGGENLNGGGTYGEHDVFDPTAGSWARAPDLPTSRHGLGSGVVGDAWIVAGGGTAAGLSISGTVEVYRP